MRYLEIDTGLKRTRCASKLVEIMPCLLVGKHFWIALVLATLLLKIVVAPLRIRRSAPHRSAASLRTVDKIQTYRHWDHRHTFDAVTPAGACEVERLRVALARRES